MSHFPSYDKLRTVEVKGQRKKCAWGLFDKNGQKDVLGCINKVTPEVIAKAASEVRDGVSISLNWPLRVPRAPGFGRKGLAHKVISFFNSPLQIHGFDDEIEFNTQCSSQWDSLCHFYDQDLKRGYNDSNPSVQDLVQDYGEEDTQARLPTLNHWHARGGLVTRGVLIDYKAYADKKRIKYSPFDPHKITIAVVEEIARDQGVMFRQGDLFVLRTGYTEAMQDANEAEQKVMTASQHSVGIENTLEAVKFFWNHHFSAVAADCIGFEVMRPTKDGVDASGTTVDYVLHPHLLALLGLHIGELWDLRALSDYCQKTGRYTFMLTSVPLNYAGALGSPPNALAIF